MNFQNRLHKTRGVFFGFCKLDPLFNFVPFFALRSKRRKLRLEAPEQADIKKGFAQDSRAGRVRVGSQSRPIDQS